MSAAKLYFNWKTRADCINPPRGTSISLSIRRISWRSRGDAWTTIAFERLSATVLMTGAKPSFDLKNVWSCVWISLAIACCKGITANELSMLEG